MVKYVAVYKPKKYKLVRIAWRYFVTGTPIWGHGDNATWLRDATIDHRGGPVERLTRARWRRVARRWAGLGVPAAFLSLECLRPWVWSSVPWLLILAAYAALAALAALAYGGHLFVLWWPQRAVRRAYVYPAYRVLAKVCGVKFRRREALASVLLPPRFTDGDVELPVKVFVPDVALDDGMRKRIVAAVGSRLGLPDATSRWTDVGEKVSVELLPMALPPADVSLADLMAELLASPLDKPVVGVAGGRRIVHTDFRNDSPHTLGSAASGAGKSTLYKFMAMQRLRHENTYAIILDFKKWSHLRWAGKMPDRVLVEDEVPRIHAVLCKVLDELLWRKSFDLHQEAELEALPTIDVYVEEINTLMPLLADWWKMEVARRKAAARRAVREARAAEDEVALVEAEDELADAMGLPITSGAVQALRYGVNLGREFHIHFHFIGQSMSAKAAGGRDTRESFRTRLLARWDRKTWKMLADGIDFVACPSGTVGIWAHVHGSEVDIVRVPKVEDEDAVAYVQGGTRPSLPMFHGEALPTTSTPAIAAVATLRELAGMLPPPGLSLDAIRKAAQRPGFPAAQDYGQGQVGLYLVDEVMAWFRERERLSIDA